MTAINNKMANVPKLRFGEFEGEWEVKALGFFLEFKNGINASKEQYGIGHKFINVLDIINNGFITHEKIIGKVNVDESTFKKSEVSYGDILFQRSSETREEVGQSNVYLDKQKKATFGGFVIRGKRVEDYNPEYLNYLLKTSKVRKEITTRAGGSTRYNVGQDVLKKVPINITPNDKEQKKIANFLSAIDKKISQVTQKVALLEQYKKGVMQQIFSQQIRFKADDGGSFPDWEEKRLGEVCNIIGGGTPETGKIEYWNGDIQWFTPTEVKKKYLHKSKRTISKLGLKKSSAKILPKGTLLLCTRATIAELSIAIEECTTNQGFQSLVANKGIVNEFIYYWVLINRKVFIRRASGSTFLEISKREIKKIKLKIPTFQEQKKIANFLSQIDEKINQTQAQLEQQQAYKKGLLQQLFI